MINGWGRYQRVNALEEFPESEKDLISILSNASSYIARGNGRSYGDPAINPSLTVNMTKFNKFLEWDLEKGNLVAESGVLISDLIKFLMPKGWFPYVTPGTKFVTLGGAIACDIHGKNHHSEGSFGKYVNWFEILNKEKKIIRCSPNENADLFYWTIGGMGLTGIITKCSIRLKKINNGWISQKIIVNNNLDETLSSFYENDDSTYSVAWIDCLGKKKNFGRSILILGEHAKHNEISAQNNLFPKPIKQFLSVPIEPPSFFLNNISISIFNSVYFFLNKRKKHSIVHWDSYFYPLDSIKDWNKMYGKNGFFQFQCVLPPEASMKGYTEILNTIQKESSGSFLAVLKKFGKGNGYFSFPNDGFTLALDFKISSQNILVAEKLTQIVKKYNGAIYLAKDALLNSSDFTDMIGQEKLNQFRTFINRQCISEQSIRLKL
jgi:FAD/FMN-containing dehydrogenase